MSDQVWASGPIGTAVTTAPDPFIGRWLELDRKCRAHRSRRLRRRLHVRGLVTALAVAAVVVLEVWALTLVNG